LGSFCDAINISRLGKQGSSLLYGLYRAVGTAVFFLSYPVILLFIRIWSRDGLGLRQRLAWTVPACRIKNNGTPRIWIHAASVGEVAAAGVLIRELMACGLPLDFVLTTMTVQGLVVARQQLPPDICSFLAPLDVARIVRRVLALVRPDIYVCLETELWPVMLGELRKRGICTVLLNGRMTAKSFRRYRLARGVMGPLLQGFAGVAVIREEDGARFAGLGIAPERIQVTGNIKFDFPPEDIPATRLHYRKRLGVDRESVFLCGSTQDGEEPLLAEVYQTLAERVGGKLIWVIAPRHLRRLAEVKAILSGLRLGFELYSELAHRQRRQGIVLVDCLGELARLYSAGDYNFVGGSLVPRGGHNIMEAVRWGRPVYYGPHIDDFMDAAHILEEAGAGFRVADAGLLAEQIGKHMTDAAAYQHACNGAVSAVAGQQGAARRQTAMITRLLTGRQVQEQDI
jgi:3-deoxy-D-manno-octulosonic-acid transferase